MESAQNLENWNCRKSGPIAMLQVAHKVSLLPTFIILLLYMLALVLQAELMSFQGITNKVAYIAASVAQGLSSIK